MVTKTLEVLNDGQSLEVYINADDKIYVCIHPSDDRNDPYRYEGIVLDLDDAKALREELDNLIKNLNG